MQAGATEKEMEEAITMLMQAVKDGVLKMSMEIQPTGKVVVEFERKSNEG